jgi:hypothetical protein
MKLRQEGQKDGRRWFEKKRTWMFSALVATTIGYGCEGGLTTLLGLLLVFLGVTPSADFAQTGRAEFNLLAQTSGEESVEEGVEEGEEAPAEKKVEYVINVFEPADTTARVDEVNEQAAEEVGTFSILLDSSGSMEQSFDTVCPTCPHDPQRVRVDAAQTLVGELLGRTPESRVGIFDFGPGATDQFQATRVLTPYSSKVDELKAGAELTVSEGGTFIYDSLCEILSYMDSDIQQHFQTKPITKAIVLVSDGEDTESSFCTLDGVIARAKDLEIPIHVVGIGAARDDFKEYYQTDEDNSMVVDSLRRLSGETGGFYASLGSHDDLVQLAEVIAIGLTGGYTKTSVVLEPIPPTGTKVVGEICPVDGETGEKVGDCEPWEFIAP